MVVAALVAFWAIRLGGHITRRSLSDPHEDARYAALRQQWAARFQLYMFGFLQVQALSGALLVVSIALAAHEPSASLRISDGLGAALLLVSILGEGLADTQLRRFRTYPANRGRVCEAGLWGWSRHPNYFFEWLGWVAYAVVAIDLSGAYPWGWLALVGPAFMYHLLLNVSGVPLLEQAMLRSRGDAYRDYQDRVSPFIPLPPKRTPATQDPSV